MRRKEHNLAGAEAVTILKGGGRGVRGEKKEVSGRTCDPLHIILGQRSHGST